MPVFIIINIIIVIIMVVRVTQVSYWSRSRMNGNLFPQRSLAHDYWQAPALIKPLPLIAEAAGKPLLLFGWPCCPC